MSKKQDRGRVRTAHDLEQKYKFGNQEKLMKEMQKAISEAKQSISDMQKDNNSTDVQKDNNTIDVFSTIVSVFLEPGQEEFDIVTAHQSGEKILSEKDIPLYDITGDGAIGMSDLLAIEKAKNGDSTLANWDKAVKSDVTITIDLSSPENLIKATGTNMWGRNVEYNTGDFIGWVLNDIEANKKKIENLRENVKALTPDDGGDISEEQIAEIQGKLETIEQDIVDIKDNAYNLRESIGKIATNYVHNNEFEELQDSVNALEGNINDVLPSIHQCQASIESLIGTATTDGIIPEMQNDIEDLKDDITAINKYTRFIAHGTQSDWNYEQISTGRIRCWRQYSPGSKEFYSLANSFCYRTNTIALPSDMFASTPTHISITAFCSDSSMAFCSINLLSNGLVNWTTLLLNSDKDSGMFNVSYFIEVVGQGYLG